VFQPTVDAASDAASVLFNLPEYRVVAVTRDESGRREVFVDTPVSEGGCPSCGVLSARVHQRTVQRIRDVPFDGQVTVWWVKKRWRCTQRQCSGATFTEHTEQVPPYARLTARLKARIVAALAGEVRSVAAVALEVGVSWPTVMRQLATAMARQAARAADRPAVVFALGIDEHRFRTVRWYKDDHQVWRRVEPWMTTFTNLATGAVIGVIDGRDSAAVKTWLTSRPRWWRHRVRVVAIDPSAAFRSAVRSLLPKARVSVDHFHLVKLGNDMVTTVRRRVSWDRHERRGRRTDLAWANRLLLMRGYNTLSERGKAKLKTVLAQDDPTAEIGAAWGVKEQLRRVLATTTVAAAQRERALFNQYVTWAAMPETTRLKNTIDTWWPAIATFIRTRATNTKTEAANVTIKNIKRTGRGYRSHDNYRCRIMLYNTARTAA
jgi:transposase